MGMIDTVTKEFISDNEVFADVVNFFVFKGEKVVMPSDLVEMDSTAISVPYGTDTSGTPVQKQRDVIKNICYKGYSDMVFAIFGVENQTTVNYAMPVRNMLYDALTYTGQVEKANQSYRKDNTKLTNEEFLSHWRKTDKLIPVITLVINFSNKKWDAPMSIYDMMDFKNDIIKTLIPDYHINIIEPASLSKEQLKMFSSGLREVMECIKYSEDMHKMREAFAENKRFECLDRKTANVIRYCSNINIDYDNNEEVINMCKAFEDYKSEGRIEGKLEGRIEGKLEGKQEMAIQFANYLIAENKSISEIAQLTGLSVEIISGLKNS